MEAFIGVCINILHQQIFNMHGINDFSSLKHFYRSCSTFPLNVLVWCAVIILSHITHAD